MEITIGEIKRDLPIRNIAPGINIALFDLLGDVELVSECAEELSRCISMKFDAILVPEVKAIPLANELAKIRKVNYIVARKKRKSYMQETYVSNAKSLTSQNEDYRFYVEKEKIETLRDKVVLLLDDVTTTGSTLESLQSLVLNAEPSKIIKAVVIVEGDKMVDQNIISLLKMPLH